MEQNVAGSNLTLYFDVFFSVVLSSRRMSVHNESLITPRACARGKVIGLVVVTPCACARGNVLGFVCRCLSFAQKSPDLEI